MRCPYEIKKLTGWSQCSKDIDHEGAHDFDGLHVSRMAVDKIHVYLAGNVRLVDDEGRVDA